MTITQDFFIDVLCSIDSSFAGHLMTSDRGLINTIQQLNDVRMYDYYSYIPLNTANRNALIIQVREFNSEKHISLFEIFKDNHLVFISCDGFEKGVISSIIPLSENFITKFVKTKICRVSDKMTITQDFFISVLYAVDNNLLCSLETSDEELINTIQQLNNIKIYDSYSADILLNKENKDALISHILASNTVEYISYFEIKKENLTLFVAYDGFEIGIISSSVSLSENFIAKFVDTKLCGIRDILC
ncbi:MAG: hypothetical protein LBR52_01970 [Prevotellaceae bacterium]|jgi:hypothetical protein|nr:hypothetical protein [Prevotellaceae bacterium]